MICDNRGLQQLATNFISAPKRSQGPNIHERENMSQSHQEIREQDLSVLNGVPVLVVEDAWHVARAMKSALSQLGMNVIGPTATTAEAKRLMTIHRPKLALVDLNLKEEMAFGLIDDLNSRGVPVVVVSGYAIPPVAIDKVAAFMQKPFSGNDLVATLLAIVRQFR